MSVTRRIISGSAAAWVRILVNLATQLALVPLYLSYWNVETYGIWVAIQALVNVLSFLDLGHQNYLGNEFLKLGNKNRPRIQSYLWSGVFIEIFIGLFVVLCILALIVSNKMDVFLGEMLTKDPGLKNQANYVALIQALVWLISGSIGGIVTRALYPFGYLPRMSWWGVFAAVITAIAPVISVVLGADLLQAGIVLGVVTVAYNVLLYFDIFRLLKKEDISIIRPCVKTALANFSRSLMISGKGLLESARQQGIRVLLAPLSGPAGLVAFTTMRTGANVALQGLGTITNPIMPELMRFLNNKDQERSEASFGTVWMVLVVFLAPCVVLLQAFIEPAYLIWTRGQIPFNPALFAFLSLGVLVYALAQPAIAVVSGNNILRPQLFIAIGSAVVVISLMFVLIPVLGILGAGIALLASEIFSTSMYRVVAKRWLISNGMKWPQKSANIAAISVILAFLMCLGMAYFAQSKWFILIFGLILLLVNCKAYWNTLPSIAKVRAEVILKKIPGFNARIKS